MVYFVIELFRFVETLNPRSLTSFASVSICGVSSMITICAFWCNVKDSESHGYCWFDIHTLIFVSLKVSLLWFSCTGHSSWWCYACFQLCEPLPFLYAIKCSYHSRVPSSKPITDSDDCPNDPWSTVSSYSEPDPHIRGHAAGSVTRALVASPGRCLNNSHQFSFADNNRNHAHTPSAVP